MKKIIVIILLVGLVGILLIGTVNRTLAGTESEGNGAERGTDLSICVKRGTTEEVLAFEGHTINWQRLKPSDDLR